MLNYMMKNESISQDNEIKAVYMLGVEYMKIYFQYK